MRLPNDKRSADVLTARCLSADPTPDVRLAGAWSSLGLILAALVFVGCAYRLGPTNGSPAGSRSIQVQPFENKTIEPRLVEAVSLALRRQLQQDGTYKLNTGQDGDIVVTGSIIGYERHSLTFVSRDPQTPRDYRLTITAHVTARERATGKTLLDRKLTGYSDIRIGPDLTSSEREALPLVAADLARNATALLVDGTW